MAATGPDDIVSGPNVPLPSVHDAMKKGPEQGGGVTQEHQGTVLPDAPHKTSVA